MTMKKIMINNKYGLTQAGLDIFEQTYEIPYKEE